jgi:hypothetical protein
VLRKVDVRDVWDAISPGVLEVWTVSRPDWRPEDLYACCLYGQADIYMPEDTNGFAIVQERLMPFRNKKTLLIWVSWDKTGIAFRKYIREIERIAAERGCCAVEFWSPRKGMQKLSGRHGYEPCTTIYQKVF